MRMIGITIGTVIGVILVVGWCSSGHAQKPPPSVTYGGSSSSSSSSSTVGPHGSTSQSQSETCVKDSFGNYTCTKSGQRIIQTPNGFTIIPGPRQ